MGLAFKPQHVYSAMIYGEILSAVGASFVNLAGPVVAMGVFSKVARPVGAKDAKLLIPLLGIKTGNAASASIVSYAATQSLDIGSRILKLDPYLSQSQNDNCLYGDCVFHYKVPLVCALCNEYAQGQANVQGVVCTFNHRRMSPTSDICAYTFECARPAHMKLPNMSRVNLVIAIARNAKNMLLVNTLSALLIGVAKRAVEVIGPSAALIPARRAYDAGAYHAPMFSKELGISGGLEGAVSLVSAVRETMGCSVSPSLSGGGFSLVTKRCPQARDCRRGEFLEVACVSYTRGLLSRCGDFDTKSEITGGVCRQEFSLRHSLHAAPAKVQKRKRSEH